MNNYKIIKERFDLQASQEETVKAQFELDKNARFLIGIAITADRDDMLYYRGTQKILINDRELFPEGYESKLLFSGLNVSPNDRMANVGIVPTGNGKLDVWFTDYDNPNLAFADYRVSIYAYSLTEEPIEP